MRILEGMDRHDRPEVPLNEWMHSTLRPYAERIIRDNNRYTLVFDKLEILIALSYAHHNHNGKWSDLYGAPLGAFLYRSENAVQILQEIRESLSTKQEESPFVTCEIFGETAEACEQGLVALGQFISTLFPRLPWR